MCVCDIKKQTHTHIKREGGGNSALLWLKQETSSHHLTFQRLPSALLLATDSKQTQESPLNRNKCVIFSCSSLQVK